MPASTDDTTKREAARLLVSSQIDVGGMKLGNTKIERFIEEHRFAGWLATSAKTGENCSDEADSGKPSKLIRLIAGTGGVIGIGFWSGAVCGPDAAAIAKVIRHAVSIVGVQHVALGSNFDGDKMPFDATGLVQITDALLAEGFSDEEVAAIMGGNLIRLLRDELPR